MMANSVVFSGIILSCPSRSGQLGPLECVFGIYIYTCNMLLSGKHTCVKATWSLGLLLLYCYLCKLYSHNVS